MKIKHLVTSNSGDVVGVIPVDGAPIMFSPRPNIRARDLGAGVDIKTVFPKEDEIPEEVLEAMTEATQPTPEENQG
jgi:hypothetical protein